MIRKFLLAIAALTVGLVVLLAALLVWPLPEMPKEGLSGDFLIRDVAVVDVAEVEVLQDRDAAVEWCGINE